MLSRCDIVVAAVSESPETHELFDSSAFAAMRDGSMFVNVGRGSLDDEPALWPPSARASSGPLLST